MQLKKALETEVMADFIKVLLAASEKAANIARIVRSEKELFKLLVEEKTEDKNDRFFQDFKTLGDVLIQECLRHDISNAFPEMSENIFGEESNKFTNALNESITVSVQGTVRETAELLKKVLDGNQDAAWLLAEEVHREVVTDENEVSHLPNDFFNADAYKDIGIWIDPIDATNEYIKGSFDGDENCDMIEGEEVIWSGGLHCVTVLIGAFEMKTGQPLVGVINQPFWKFDPTLKRWQGRKIWGVSANNQHVSALVRYPLSRNHAKPIVITSTSDADNLKNCLEGTFQFVYSAGAGYKLLCVALGLADAYVFSKSSTHFWDTCGPHAILRSLGGGIVGFDDVVHGRDRFWTAARNGDGNCVNGTQNGNGTSTASSAASASAVLRKVSSFKELSYAISADAEKTKYVNGKGLLAYRENQIGNLAVQSIIKAFK